MADFLRRTWAVVRLDNISYNISKIRSLIPKECLLMGVVKADAYGHGDKLVAREMVSSGVDWFGVSNINEAIELRQGKIYKPILIFGATPPEMAEELCKNDITQALYSLDYALMLQEKAEEAGVNVDCHIKLDTGMGRIGFDAREIMETCDQIERAYYLPNLRIKGIFSHFACSDEDNASSREYTKMQYDYFDRVCKELEGRGLGLGIKHIANSGATLLHNDMTKDMVRPGILPYGLYPSADCLGKIELRAVMELYSAVTLVKSIKKGDYISYGRTFRAERDMTVATIPIGYADGYSRLLSNKGRVLIRGKYARIIGRICMDQMMVDVTDIDGVCFGDLVTLVGRDGDKEISFDELASLSGTINYESVCLIGKRVPRIYKRYGETVGVVDYTGLNLE